MWITYVRLALGPVKFSRRCRKDAYFSRCSHAGSQREGHVFQLIALNSHAVNLTNSISKSQKIKGGQSPGHGQPPGCGQPPGRGQAPCGDQDLGHLRFFFIILALTPECTHLVLREASQLCLQNCSRVKDAKLWLNNDWFSFTNSKQTTLLLENQEENEDLVPTGLWGISTFSWPAPLHSIQWTNSFILEADLTISETVNNFST